LELDRAQVGRLIESVSRKIREKVAFWSVVHAPLELPRTHPHGSRQRFRLGDLVELAKIEAFPFPTWAIPSSRAPNRGRRGSD
jgi:hypothetical protein